VSAQLTIRDAVVAQLLQSPALAGGRVVANRHRPVPAEAPTQIFVYLEQSQATPAATSGDNRIDWQTQIRVECLARAVTGTSADDAADTLAAAAYARLMGNANLGGVLLDPLDITAMGWAEDEADGQLSGVQILLTARHRTDNNTLINSN
jgi:hypothetical protein